MGRRITRRGVVAWDLHTGQQRRFVDKLAGEEPLALRVAGEPLTVTMRTPGHDIELAHGFLLSEGIINSAQEVLSARYCAGKAPDGPAADANTYNVLDIELDPAAAVRARCAVRQFATTSSCGVCGRASIDDVLARIRRPTPLAAAIPAELVAGLPERLRAGQRVFDQTGGLHAAGLYDPATDRMLIREDIGRHNAADKAIGARLLEGGAGTDGVLALSGRMSFDLVQKAAMAGIRVVAAVSAPSSLAAELAESCGITAVGFVRDGRMNVYSHPEQLRAAGQPVGAEQPQPASRRQA